MSVALSSSRPDLAPEVTADVVPNAHDNEVRKRRRVDHWRIRSLLRDIPVTLLITAVSTLFCIVAMLGTVMAPVDARADGHEFSAYIESTALNVRSNPGTDSEVIGILLKYDPVTVVGEQNVGSTTWYSIKASGGYTSGWVSAHFVKRGDPPQSASMTEVDYGKKQTPTLMPGDFQYVGAGACQECHEDAVADFPKGAYGVWKSHFHSAAFTTLGKGYTKEIASRGRGIDDPETDWRCVKCHVTALGAAPSQLGPGYNEQEGVGCEVCHGPGGTYAQEDHGPDASNREAMGFRVLRNLDERREVCTSCHNKASPTYKPFDLRQFSREIAHWVDEGDNEYRAEAGRESERRAKSVVAVKSTPKTAPAPESDTKKKAAAAAGAATAAGGAIAATTAATADEAAKSASSAAADAASKSAAAADKAAADAAARAASAKAKAKAAADAKAAQAAAASQEAERRAAAERKRLEDEKRAAEASAAAAAAKAKADAERRAKAATPPPPAPAAVSDNPLAHYLKDVSDVIVMNKGAKKYEKVKFPHLKHAGNEYLPGGDCQTCHHTQEGTDSPEACNDCHNIGGDAEEEKPKKRFAHDKKKGYPLEEDQEQVSCVGCHKSMNKMLDAGERQGDEAPTKCTTCHARK